MKIAATTLIILSLLALSVQGKKTKITYTVNSHHVHTYRHWWSPGCDFANRVFVVTNDGTYKEPFEPGVFEGPGDVFIYGEMYYDCNPTWRQALRTHFSYAADFPEFPGVHTVNGVINATVSIKENIIVTTSECTFNDEYWKYVCDAVKHQYLPWTFNHTGIFSGGTYTYRDKSMDRGPGYVVKANTVSTCKDIKTGTFDVTLGGKRWNTGSSYMDSGHLCKYDSGYAEKYTVS